MASRRSGSAKDWRRCSRLLTEAAYAEAWALSFFLSEQEPRKYVQYLMKTAAVKDFVAYPAPQRLKDFTDIFGGNLGLLDARMQRFIGELK
ncbi:MAG: DUF1570 domain-containing protein [Planctomycetales bacterium]|nr:DUF1570 domain-containing protein [Planctomycetales bacterium]